MAVNYDKYILSTGTHYISNSGKDEHSGTKGGQAGDQTGREWELKKWYNRPWTVVLRHPDQAVALTIARLSIAAALNDKIGYDQSQRGTYWQQLVAAGYDPSKITTPCEEDCTAGVSANVKAAGHLHGLKKLEDLPICSSRNMRAQFTAAGFIALTDSKYLTGPKYLLPGDVLLYESHHAAANVTLGAKVRDQWCPENAAGSTVETIPSLPAEPSSPASDADPDAAFDGNVAVITGSTVNIRTLPRLDDAPLGTAKQGETFPCIGETFDEEWLFIEWQGRAACVSAKYAEVK